MKSVSPTSGPRVAIRRRNGNDWLIEQPSILPLCVQLLRGRYHTSYDRHPYVIFTFKVVLISAQDSVRRGADKSAIQNADEPTFQNIR